MTYVHVTINGFRCKRVNALPLRIQLLATAVQMWNSSSPLQNIWNQKKLLYIQCIIFSPDWNLIMDLSINQHQCRQCASYMQLSQFKILTVCSIYCFIWDIWNTLSNILACKEHLACMEHTKCHILLTCSSGKREKWPTFDKNSSYQPDIWKTKTNSST